MPGPVGPFVSRHRMIAAYRRGLIARSLVAHIASQFIDLDRWLGGIIAGSPVLAWRFLGVAAASECSCDGQALM